jgi:hypothetical protein
LRNALLDDAFTMVEHGNMSLPEALKMGLSFLSMYKKSSSFDLVSKRLESDHLHKMAIISRLDTVIKTNVGRR